MNKILHEERHQPENSGPCTGIFWHSSFDHHSVGELLPIVLIAFFQVCHNSAASENSGKKPGLNVINPNLFGLLTLTFPHIFSLSQHTVLLSLSLPRWHVDSSLLVGISFQWAGWEGQRDVVIISISGCLAAFPSACWQTLAIEQLSGRKGVGCGLKLHRSRSFLSKSH